MTDIYNIIFYVHFSVKYILRNCVNYLAVFVIENKLLNDIDFILVISFSANKKSFLTFIISLLSLF